MATIKAYTDIEQSKRLAEILPLESADMYWWSTSLRYYIEAMDDGDFNEEEGHIRAWSLAALLDVFRTLGNKHTVFGTSVKESKWHVLYHNFDKLLIEDSGLYSNLVDACVELVLKLHELKML